MKVVLLCLVVLAVAQGQRVSKIVNIAQGPVRGYKVPNFDVFRFNGIPYATAPTGRDRFKAPLPPPNWTEPFESVEGHILCPQQGRDESSYTEDCLIINVATPDTNETNLPVIFLVHGGGFQTGYGTSESPDLFVNTRKNVIAITFNYRLGPHGYVCLGTPDVPGNAGMKDIVTALRWVNVNIAAFGGNPNDVTLAGCSAGGSAVHLLMLSKTTQGLYNKVIGQSGAAISAFGVQMDPIENARDYARKLNYNGPDNVSALEEFYKNVTYEQLFAIDLGTTKDVAVVFSPCLEKDLGSEVFLDDTPTNILKSGNFNRVPMLYGWTNMEGLLRIWTFDEWKIEMSEDFAPFLPADLQFASAEEKSEVALRVKEFYFGEGPIRDDQIINYINFHTDVMFVYTMQRELPLLVEAGNNEVYLSVYSYVTNMTRPIPNTEVNGADHCVQASAAFAENGDYLTQEDLNMIRTVRDVWLNFVQTGHPTPEGLKPASMPYWEPAHANRTPCMSFDNTIQVLPGVWARERQEFWDDIYDRYHREPIAPNKSSEKYGLSLFSVLILSFVLRVLNSTRSY